MYAGGMTEQKATIGRIVHIELPAADAEAINRRRADAQRSMAQHREAADGSQIHVGNTAYAGDVAAAIVVRAWGGDNDLINAQVFLDGNDAYWVTSRAYGDGPGQWSWPPRV